MEPWPSIFREYLQYIEDLSGIHHPAHEVKRLLRTKELFDRIKVKNEKKYFIYKNI